ncbi:MAG: 7-cyano-7-deazaguanine synthase QueC [Rickettsiales bacterium]|nr:7-cyano-7-deazaguanine synthase QueC [Rickettsiales bacterium]
MKVVVLASGGLDSSTIIAMLDQKEYQIYALSFNYAQNHQVEIEKVSNFIKNYNVIEHRIVNLDLSAFAPSALVNKNIQVPKYVSAKDIGSNIPVTYVPARNTIFLSYALGYAEAIGAKEIYIGAHDTDSANYPDCRLEYIEAFQRMANLATKSAVEGEKIIIKAPLIKMSKSDIVAIGMRLGVDYSKTITCYDPSPEAFSCGKCHACLVRISAFEANNITDTAKYAELV